MDVPYSNTKELLTGITNPTDAREAMLEYAKWRHVEGRLICDGVKLGMSPTDVSRKMGISVGKVTRALRAGGLGHLIRENGIRIHQRNIRKEG